jgi:hypothetical protein
VPRLLALQAPLQLHLPPGPQLESAWQLMVFEQTPRLEALHVPLHTQEPTAPPQSESAAQAAPAVSLHVPLAWAVHPESAVQVAAGTGV